MPLYENILSPRAQGSGNEDSGSAAPQRSNASMKLLQDHLMSKRRSTCGQPSKAQQKQQAKAAVSKKNLHRTSENDWDPDDEYDPLMPNSYEALQAEYLKNEELRLVNLKNSASSGSSRKLADIPNLMDIMDQLDECDGFTGQNLSSVKKVKGTAIAPPPSLSSASALSSSPDNQGFASRPVRSTPATATGSTDGGSVAAKIMSKMGYKLGQGLGKDEQGISAPLEVEKSGTNVGRILFPPVAPSQPQPTASIKDDKMAEMLRESTRVLLLQNMVGPGEVDEDLEAETKEECKKYGDVVKCLIFEIPNKRVPDDEAVRIFVEFKQVESAIKAANDLNGRYFGGRVVRASFYPVDKLNKYELGPS